MRRRVLYAVPSAALLTLASAVVLLPAASADAAAAAPTCHGRRATIVETESTDGVIRGTPGPDVIVASAANNTVYAGAGDDVVCGGDGADVIFGGSGDDRLYGQRGYRYYGVDDAIFIRQDTLIGGHGDDLLDGGTDRRSAEVPLRDTYSWESSTRGVHLDLRSRTARGEGRDTLAGHGFRVVGSPYGDTIDGSRGADVIVAGAGPDVVRGGGGVDAITADAEENGPGVSDSDRVWGGPGGDYITSSRGRDRINGGAGDDHIETLGPGADAVDGEDGADELRVEVADGRGSQRYDGGAGADLVVLFTRELNPAGDASTGIYDMRSGAMRLTVGHPLTLAVLAEHVHLATPGTAWAVTGTRHDDEVSSGLAVAGITFSGLAGDDSLQGSDAPDFFDGGSGHDRAAMQGGVDTCIDVEIHDQDSCELTG